jgi:hypothetical protein
VVAQSSIVVGSGTSTVGVPVTSTPEAVPNENVASEIVDTSTRPGMLSRNTAASARNGLCGPFPAIDELAFEYSSTPAASCHMR